MRYGFAYNGFSELPTLLELAVAADDGLADRIWLAEHLGYRDAFVPAAALLAHTNQVGVVPTAVSPYSRNPMITAMQAASLAELAPGRVSLVVGAGNPMAYAEAGMFQERPLTAVREYLEAMRALWTQKRVQSYGRMFRIDGASFHVPMSQAPKMHIAATGEQMLALAGREADGVVFSAGLPPEALKAACGKVRAAAAEAGRDPSAIETVAFIATAVGGQPDQVVDQARDTLTYILRNPAVAAQADAAGLQVDADRLRAATASRNWKLASQEIGDSVVERCALAGTQEDCLRAVPRYHNLGLDSVVLFPIGGSAGEWATLDLLSRL